jgi:hypothetical protein
MAEAFVAAPLECVLANETLVATPCCSGKRACARADAEKGVETS